MATQRAIEMVHAGEPALEFLRASCSTTKALSCAITRVRKAVLDALPVPPEVHGAMQPYAREPGVATFLQSSLRNMVEVQRMHRSTPEWSDEAERALHRLVLVPPALAELKLSHAELLSLKHTQEAGLLKKQAALVRIPNALQWLQYAVQLARTSDHGMSIARLALPLLLLTGRRETEILNGKSVFTPTPRPTTCVFSGQLKKRGKAVPYEIPLLCDLPTVLHALRALRCKQEFQVLEPAACNATYAQQLITKHVFPFCDHPHQLRAAYAAYAFCLYARETTFNLAAMRMLGHEKLETSLSYNSVVLDGMEGAPHLGRLP